MKMKNSLVCRYSCVLENALMKGIVKFPSDCLHNFKKIKGYRMVTKKENEATINEEDFLSQIELLQRGKNIRPIPDKNDIGNYSCSLFYDLDQLKIIMKLPRKNKKIIQGYIHDSKGTIQTNKSNTHIHWWIYAQSNPHEDFEVMKFE